MLQSPRPSGDSRSCRNINWQPSWAEICLIADYRGTDFQVSAAYLMPTLDGVSMVQWRWKLGVGSLESRVWRLDFASDPAVPAYVAGYWFVTRWPFLSASWAADGDSLNRSDSRRRSVWATPDWSVARTPTDSREYAAIIPQNVARRSLIRFSLTILQWCRCSAIARSYGRCADFNYPSELAIKSWVAQSMCTGENKRYLYGSEIYINSSSL